MKAKYTEGPWTVGQVGSQPVFDLLGPDITGRGREVIGTIRACQNRESNKANAALIASAPDLLAACKAALEAYRNEDYDDYFHGEQLEVILEKAIEKAEGNQ